MPEDNVDKDGNAPYVFLEENQPNSASLSGNCPVTHNHSLLLEMDKNCYSKTVALKNIQKLLLWLIAFFYTYKLDVYIAASLFYLILAISTIHTMNLDQMRDLLFFVPKYSSLIYTSILYTIGIFLQKYSNKNFSMAFS